jgi:membrane-bound lytic murein transglycosylase D
MTTPPDDPDFELVLPKGYADKFNEKIAGLPESERVRWQYHTVRRGDTLGAVARRYGTTVAQITQANNISVRKTLQVGQSLVIPVSGVVPKATQTATAKTEATNTALPEPGETYTVRRGDTLGKIAARYGTTAKNLQAWNNLPSTTISVGKKLIVAKRTQPEEPGVLRKVVHKVKVGETLNKIASVYKTTVAAIVSWNKSDNLNVIHPGDQITIFLGEAN